jgi:Zn-dependent M28 family amino/carboxypeptidase
MSVAIDEAPATTQTLLFDIPGQSGEWVVLSAHVDGHDLAESAIDNASGVVAALSVARALARDVPAARRGLRLAFFSVEEWALMGSAQYVDGLTMDERASIALNVNLDSVAGSPKLAAMTSGFAGLEPFLRGAARDAGHALRCFRPLLANSDHANFVLAGIPAFRLVAGFDDPNANTRLVLTNADSRDKVAAAELIGAAQVAASIVAAALDAGVDETKLWRHAAIAAPANFTGR